MEKRNDRNTKQLNARQLVGRRNFQISIGFQQNTRVVHTTFKQHTPEQYINRLTVDIAKSKLNSTNVFRFIKWTKTNTKNIHTVTNTQ